MPEKLADAVLRFIDEPLRINPMRVTKPLSGQMSGLRSGYVGITVRVIIKVDPHRRVVDVVRIALRADAYR